MQNKDYKNLIVYQKSRENTVKLAQYFAKINLGWTEKYIIDQMIRASASIGANLAEGYGRLSKLDFRRFVLISRGSSFELDYWIDLYKEINSKHDECLDGVSKQNLEVVKMLSSLMKKLKE